MLSYSFIWPFYLHPDTGKVHWIFKYDTPWYGWLKWRAGKNGWGQKFFGCSILTFYVGKAEKIIPEEVVKKLYKGRITEQQLQLYIKRLSYNDKIIKAKDYGF
jgi:hypothetical protein